MPGHLSATGTVRLPGLTLVYVMRASDDQKVVRVTLKEKGVMSIKDKGARGIKGYTVVEKHQIAERIH